MKLSLPEEEIIKFKKANRAKKLFPKKHKIVHEYGRSTKTLWAHIISKSKNK